MVIYNIGCDVKIQLYLPMKLFMLKKQRDI